MLSHLTGFFAMSLRREEGGERGTGEDTSTDDITLEVRGDIILWPMHLQHQYSGDNIPVNNYLLKVIVFALGKGKSEESLGEEVHVRTCIEIQKEGM